MIAIIEGCGSNISSLLYAIERLNRRAIVTVDPQIITNASHVILAGVNAAPQAMKQLQKNNLLEIIKQLQQPTLGICLGMQLLFEDSEEGNSPGLAIIPGRVKKLTATDHCIVPHMGWNQLTICNPQSSLFSNMSDNSYMYFAHSYAIKVQEFTSATTHHGELFSSSVQRDNFYGVQFHPELSGKTGEQLLNNFFNL